MHPIMSPRLSLILSSLIFFFPCPYSKFLPSLSHVPRHRTISSTQPSTFASVSNTKHYLFHVLRDLTKFSYAHSHLALVYSNTYYLISRSILYYRRNLRPAFVAAETHDSVDYIHNLRRSIVSPFYG
ncbi:hypothetical protein F5Y00DRAFT_160522 [Daldinia vernicosa]|uniref:uncharacterized protein n=1 Tax=Daldinia vernicosa TaxID=114800 RepID=UPI0020082F6F|nr:uncharacterized protein F5Y00DRAFT_160522 [Daldinia vernicosa]KAI0845801.1 hypothetical protein F5Y00DRAFT_160522 [Daldinia vernicosa]